MLSVGAICFEDRWGGRLSAWSAVHMAGPFLSILTHQEQSKKTVNESLLHAVLYRSLSVHQRTPLDVTVERGYGVIEECFQEAGISEVSALHQKLV